MKVFCHIPRENWFCDRFGKEYQEYSTLNVSHEDLDCDLIWLLASWCWNQIPYEILKSNRVVCTIHHEVPWKFDENRLNNFMARDEIVDAYHVPCNQTKEFISKITSKPIYKIGYWCNNHLWKRCENRDAIKTEFGLPLDRLVVSSFQRDTEGNDLITPKLEKGPDLFCDVVETLNKRRKIHVLLNGWRRQYIISELEKRKIPFTYHELPEINDVVRMYSATDLYIVTSRVEGGPQSLLECSATRTPIVSTDMGMARDVLSSGCIIDDLSGIEDTVDKSYMLTEENYSNVIKFFIENHVKEYDNLFRRIVEKSV